MKSQFYMVLPSNSSMNVFPDNTTSCYITKLPQEINLHGSWEVGITEIHFPRTFFHLSKKEREIGIANSINPVFLDRYSTTAIENTEFTVVNIPYGIYDGIMEFLDRVNNAIKRNTHIMFKFSVDHNNTYIFAELTCDSEKCNYEHSLKMSRSILNILGFVGVKVYLKVDYNKTFATRPADILSNLPRQLYIYTDVCEPCIVGDTQTSLLRIVPVNYKDYTFGSNQYQIFAPINYMPLIRNCFRTITIDIRDNLGQQVPFELGTSTVTLHFRQID